MTLRVLHVVCACLLALACGGGSSNTEGAENAGTIEGPPKPWADMDGSERRRYMADRVLPTMAELFTAYDPERFADFSCMTCHGDNAGAVAFHMPNRLPVLWPSGTPEQRRMVELQPDMARFMFNRVLPTMTQLLGQPAWNNEDKTGFSCFNCHPHAEPEVTTPTAASPTEQTP